MILWHPLYIAKMCLYFELIFYNCEWLELGTIEGHLGCDTLSRKNI